VNVEYQFARHFALMRFMWPKDDPKDQAAQIRRLIKIGQIWLFPEPVQLELFQ